MAVSKVKRVGTRDKMMKIVKKGDKKVYLIAQELNLVRALADNNKSSRDKAVKKLKAWFANRTGTMPFTEGDLQRIWKGLFYSMWMSDKPLIQEECAENISNLVHFNTLDSSLLFFKAGLTILMNEWFGIDQLRLDKFYMLVRRLLRQILFVLQKHSFNKKNIVCFNNILSETILRTTSPAPLGLFMHFTEIFMEELAKVSKGHIDPNRVVDMIIPFLEKMISTNDGREIRYIRKFIFTYLIRQSDLGLEYQAKYDAWKQEGFPGNIDSMQKVKVDCGDHMSTDEDDNEDISDKPLDPRAGRVNVELPQIKFNSEYVASVLLKYKFHESSTTRSRKMITTLIEQFSKLSKGIYPLGIKTLEIKSRNNNDLNIRKATNRLIKFEQKLMGKKRKKKPEKENKEESVVEKKRLKVDNASISKEGKHVVVLQNEKVLTENNKTKKKRKKSSINNLETETNICNTENILQHNGANQDQNNKIIRSDSGHIENKKNKLKSKRQKMMKSKRNKAIVNNIECVFERNSGTWVVYDMSRVDKNEIVPSAMTEVGDVIIQDLENPTKSSEHLNKLTKSNNLDKTKLNIDKEICSKKKLTSDKSMCSIQSKQDISVQNGSPKSGLSPVKLFESSPDRKELFSKSAWEEPLQEGEYEICIPSKKYVGKLKKLATKHDSTVQTRINNSMKMIRGKCNSSMIRNRLSTPNSTKKVKINTNLNRSQEVHEHHAQILSSPAIPYDANKKPSKPLLKTPLKLTTINPFYRKQLS